MRNSRTAARIIKTAFPVISWLLLCTGYTSAQKIYWTEYTFGTPVLHRVHPDGSNHIYKNLNSGNTQKTTPQGLAVRNSTGQLFWSELVQNHGSINRIANAPGISGTLDSIASGLSSARGMVIDQTNGMAYWVTTEGGANTIRSYNFAASTAATLVTFGADNNLRDIAIDETNRILYVTDFGKGQIHAVNAVTGTYTTPVTGLIMGNYNTSHSDPYTITNGPSGIAFDPVSQKIFWTEFNTSRLYSATPSGGNITYVTGVGSRPEHVFIDKIYRKIFISDNNSLKSADISNTGSITAFTNLTTTGVSYVNFGGITTGPNIAPQLADKSVSAYEDAVGVTITKAEIQALYSDAEGDLMQYIKIKSLPSASAGTLKYYAAGNLITVVADAQIPMSSFTSLVFVPAANYFGSFSIAFQISDGSDYSASAQINYTIIPVADTPTITGAATNEDVQSTSGLVISRNTADGAEVTNFKITSITHGKLYKNNGTTEITAGSFITFAEGNAGLKFTPDANYFGSATITTQASLSAADAGLGGSTVNATVTINPIPDAPVLADAETNEDVKITSGFVLSRNAADNAEVTHFKITGITHGKLYKSDGTTEIANGTFITSAEGNAGLQFAPDANFFGDANITSTASLSNSDAGLGLAVTNTKITIKPVADTPSITDAVTDEDVQSTAGLVISKNAADAAEVTHFKITGITNGKLFKNDGTTEITNGTYITSEEGSAGLKFTPDANYFGTGNITVQAAVGNTDANLGGSTVTAVITVNAINDEPTLDAITSPAAIRANTGEQTINLAGISAGPGETQTLTVTALSNNLELMANPTVTYTSPNAAGTLKYTPRTDIAGTVTITVRVTDNGTPALYKERTFDVVVLPLPHDPAITAATTNEDQKTTDGLVVSRNVLDDASITHFKITSITNGKLYKNDGTTEIANGTFLTFAEANAGLKFNPAANFSGTGSFGVQSSLSADDNGLGGNIVTAQITVNPVADQPSVTSASASEDNQTASGLAISRNAADGSEITHFKITNIAHGKLYLNDGTTEITSGSFITYAQGNVGLRFTPAANYFGAASFDVQGAASGTGTGLGVSAAADIQISPVADSPAITDAASNEDAQTSSGLVISRNAADGNEVTHFKISGITNGKLYKTDGTTEITNGTFITFAEGNAGLKFTPDLNYFGTANVTAQASTSAADAGLGGNTVNAQITINPLADTPSITDASTSENTKTSSGLVLSRNVADNTEVTHFKITGITHGKLLKHDGTTEITNGSFITFAEGNAGLVFYPDVNFNGTANVTAAASLSDVDAGVGGSSVTASITVSPVANTPSVTAAATNEDVQSTSGLVISRNAADGAEVTHFKITGITNGKLYKNDGTTEIADGTFITFAEGNAGLKFTPSQDFSGTGNFTIQASVSSADAGLGGSTVAADITVNPVNDAPLMAAISDPAAINEDAAEQTVNLSGISAGPNETQGLAITATSDNTSLIANPAVVYTSPNAAAVLKYTPAANKYGTAVITVRVTDDDVSPKYTEKTFTVTVDPVADLPGITSAVTDEDAQSASGLVISRNAADNTEVTHFEISSISHGKLYKQDGTTEITNGSYITFAEGNAGLKFTPDANYFGTASFNVKGAVSNTGLGLSSSAAASVTVNPVADLPSITAAVTNEDNQSSTGLVISRNIADNNEVTHFKVTNISHGKLYKNDGTTEITDGTFITFAEGNAGLKFTPAANFFGAAAFKFQASVSNTDAGLGSSQVDALVTVNAVADIPSVTTAATNEDIQSSTGLVISRNAADGAEITHFRITGISNGLLYKNNGTTQILNNDYITYAEGNAGLKFTPAANYSGLASFSIQGAASNTGSGLGAAAASEITVVPVADNPSISSAATTEDVQSAAGLVISRNAADGAEVTHFKISGITNGKLYKNDGLTEITNGNFITFAEGNSGLKFTPALNFYGTANVSVQASTSNSDAGLGGSTVTASVTVSPAPDAPSITAATVDEDTQSSSGLVISRNTNDGAEVTHFKITDITNGKLYKNDGTTEITNGSFITAAEGSAGLKFSPAANYSGSTSFKVYGSLSSSDAGLGEYATAQITINPVNDEPLLAAISNPAAIIEDASEQSVSITGISSGPGETQTLTVTAVSGNTALIPNPKVVYASPGSAAELKYTPAANMYGTAVITVRVTDDGTPSLFTEKTFIVTVNPAADQPSVASAEINEDSQASDIIINRNPADGAEVTHFRISGLTAGTLYMNDGITQIADGSFITFADAQAGLKFSPGPDYSGTVNYTVQASLSNTDAGIGGSAASGEIRIIPVADTPSITGADTEEDKQTASGLVISRNAVDGPEVSHFRITGISSGKLYLNDGITEISDGSFITTSEGGAGLKFTPSENFFGQAGFSVQASTSSNNAGLGGSITSTKINVSPLPDAPVVTDAETAEDSQSTAGLVITRNASDGPEVTHFRVSSITKGKLYKNDGSTEIAEGTFITASEAGQGLKFSPEPNYSGPASFSVQSASSANDNNPGPASQVHITIKPVNDPPVFASMADIELDEDALPQIIDINGITAGPMETQKLTLSVKTDNSVLVLNPVVEYTSPDSTGKLKFSLAPETSGKAVITLTLTDDGIPAMKTERTFTVEVGEVNDAPVIVKAGNQSVFEDSVKKMTVTYIDPDKNDSHVISVKSNNPNVTVRNLSGNQSGSTYELVPSLAWYGTANMTVVVKDNSSLSDTDRYVLTVINQNDPPTAVNLVQVKTYTEGVPGVVPDKIVVTDTDTLDIISVSITLSNTRAGKLASGGGAKYVDSTGVWSVSGYVQDVNLALDNLSFLPEINNEEDAVLTVRIRDKHNTGPAEGKIELKVIPVNDLPQFACIADTVMNEDAAELKLNLTDINAGPGEKQKLTLTAVSSDKELVSDPVIDYTSPNSSAVLKLKPAANRNGNALITVRLTDDGTPALSFERSFMVKINPVNDSPVADAIKDPGPISEDAPEQSVTITGISAGPNENQELTITASSSNKALISDPAVVYTSPAAAAVLKYKPAANQSGTATVTVKITDDGSPQLSFETSFNIAVKAVNDPPVIAALPEFTFNEDDSLTFDINSLYKYVTDSDNNQSELKFLFDLTGTHITLMKISESNYTLKTPANWFGKEVIRVGVCDLKDTARANLTVNVKSVNDLPLVKVHTDTLKFRSDSTVTVSLWNIFEDVETPDSLLKYSVSFSNDSLTAGIDRQKGILIVSAKANIGGYFTMTVTAEDDSSAKASDKVTVNVIKKTTGIEETGGAVEAFALYQNYPNPFNPSTVIRFSLPEPGTVNIEIFNMLGQKVEELFRGEKSTGIHELYWSPAEHSSGMYIYSIHFRSSVDGRQYSSIKKMLFVK